MVRCSKEIIPFFFYGTRAELKPKVTNSKVNNSTKIIFAVVRSRSVDKQLHFSVTAEHALVANSRMSSVSVVDVLASLLYNHPEFLREKIHYHYYYIFNYIIEFLIWTSFCMLATTSTRLAIHSIALILFYSCVLLEPKLLEQLTHLWMAFRNTNCLPVLHTG